jgi:hypothetical protein
MSAQPSISGSQQKSAPAALTLLTAREAARVLKVSVSWLAKARMRGDGPAYNKVGRAIRYTELALQQWLKGNQRLSTSEH